MAKYDEDLHDNPFFIHLSEKFSDLFTLASDKCWMICVPRFETVSRTKIHKQDIETHILIPEKELEVPEEEETGESASSNGQMDFITFNGKYLSVHGEYITTGAGFKEKRKVKILFDESFFNSKDQSYQVLCIDKLLEGGPEEQQPLMVVSLETLEDCHKFLWNNNDPGSEKVKKTVDSYLCTLTVKIDSTPDQIKEIACGIYETALNEIAKLPHIRKLHSASGKQFFALATETYILNKIHSQLFRLLCRTELGDTEINRYTRKACDIQLGDLGIKHEYSAGILRAREHLLRLNKCSSPFEKTRCFKQTISSLGIGGAKGLTADELLPILVYLVLTSEISNWKVNLFYIKEFHFSSVGGEEILYYLTSFEAAVEYITTKSLEDSISIGRARFYDKAESLEVKRLRSFFDCVAREDVENMEKLLKLPDDISKSLCHPLCDCEKCSPIVQNYHDDPARISIYSRDSLNRTGLHYAALMGQAVIMQRLSELNSDIDAVDINHHTPLHLSCLHGNQKCVLFLLSEGASINKTDRYGNTPLHLACSHGHEECIKALIFNKKCNVNAQNNQLDTPLHLAARWNYVSVVTLLLDHGAQLETKNKLNDTPARTSYNTKIFVNLHSLSSRRHSSVSSLGGREGGGRGGEAGGRRRRSEKEEIDSGGRQFNDTKIKNTDSITRADSKLKRRSTVSSDITSETDKQLKKLFCAIHDHDISMVKYLFGNRDQLTPTEGGGASGSAACHPLCQCEKCLKSRKGQPVYTTVNVCDSRGHTPLHKAAINGARVIVDYFIAKGAMKDARTKDELLTPLHLACQYNHKDVVMKLLENGAEVNPHDIRGNTPLHFCCNNGHMDSAALLLIHGADVTASNDRGDTPLHNAARWNHSSLAKELILYGAQYSQRNNEDKTPDDLTTDDEVHDVIKQAENGEISIGEYKPLSSPPHAGSPNISDDDEFEHV